MKIMILLRSTTVTLLLILLCRCQPDPQHLTIGIQPFGKITQEHIAIVSSAIQAEYKSTVVILAPQKIPDAFFVNTKTPRYRADSILHYLRKSKPDSIDILLGVTDVDISVTKRENSGKIKEPKTKYADWGVFGYGYMPGASSVISVYRIKRDAAMTGERLKKIALHEIGHNLGLPHCQDAACCMVDAVESIATVDQATEHLCSQCRKKINAAL